MIVDLFKYSVKPGFTEKVIGHLREHAVQTRAEEGCLFVNVFSSNTDEKTLYLLLAWENQEAIDKHLFNVRDQQFSNNVRNYLYGPSERIDWKMII